MPTVSIILPTYNRAKFLPQAFESIRSQEWTDWELIVVDDGSTDETRELITKLTQGWPQPVRYICQENQGPYGARNTGLDHAQGKYVAFFDSDDVWRPHHLAHCVREFGLHEDVDWVFGACRMLNQETESVIAESHFRQSKPAPFLQLRTERRGELNIIADDKALPVAIEFSLECGLQHSVIRRTVFKTIRFQTDFRNEAEDQLTVIRAVANGFRLAYLDKVHVDYYVHSGNSSGAALNSSVSKRLAVFEGLVRGFELLPNQIRLTSDARRSLRRRLNKVYFWQIGYAILWNGGRRREAIDAFRRGLGHWPWSIACWKTFVLASIRSVCAAPTGCDGTHRAVTNVT